MILSGIKQGQDELIQGILAELQLCMQCVAGSSVSVSMSLCVCVCVCVFPSQQLSITELLRVII